MRIEYVCIIMITYLFDTIINRYTFLFLSVYYVSLIFPLIIFQPEMSYATSLLQSTIVFINDWNRKEFVEVAQDDGLIDSNRFLKVIIIFNLKQFNFNDDDEGKIERRNDMIANFN